MVAREGVEPPTTSLFRAVFFEPKPFFNQQLNSSRWPLYCDHSVTSADVRLSVGVEVFRIAGQIGLTGREATVGGMSSELP